MADKLFMLASVKFIKKNKFSYPKYEIFSMSKAASAAALRQAQSYGGTGKWFPSRRTDGYVADGKPAENAAHRKNSHLEMKTIGLYGVVETPQNRPARPSGSQARQYIRVPPCHKKIGLLLPQKKGPEWL
jgi:hypothetical protein